MTCWNVRICSRSLLWFAAGALLPDPYSCSLSPFDLQGVVTICQAPWVLNRPPTPFSQFLPSRRCSQCCLRSWEPESSEQDSPPHGRFHCVAAVWVCGAEILRSGRGFLRHACVLPTCALVLLYVSRWDIFSWHHMLKPSFLYDVLLFLREIGISVSLPGKQLFT